MNKDEQEFLKKIKKRDFKQIKTIDFYMKNNTTQALKELSSKTKNPFDLRPKARVKAKWTIN